METIIDQAHKIHKTLAHSYSLYLGALFLGLTLDYFYRFTIFSHSAVRLSGLALLMLSTLLIFWAQATNRNLNTNPLTAGTFSGGPYRYSRMPTHWGLFLMMIGFGIVSNATFVVISALIAFIVTRLTFVRHQEEALERKYGAPYLEYKRSVRF